MPLAFEVTIVSGLLARHCGAAFAGITIATLSTYAAFTFVVVRMRTHIRKAQNAADTQASQRCWSLVQRCPAILSLLWNSSLDGLVD